MSEALYQSIVLEHSRAPLYAGRPDMFDAQGHGENRMCGDSVTVFFTRKSRGWRHEAQGCAILTASADLMCAALNGRSEADIARLDDEFERLVKTGVESPFLGDLNAFASITQYPARFRCATLPWNAVRSVIASGDARHG